MRIAKKLLAVLLSCLMLVSLGAVCASAVTAPEFELSLVSETDKEVVVKVTFIKGDFNAFNAEFVTSSAIRECTSIVPNESGFAANIGYAQTKKITALSMNAVKNNTLICTATFAKKTSAKITESDIKLVFDSCAASVDTATGVQNIDVTDSVKVTTRFSSFVLNTTSLAMNYKQSAAISYDSNYSADALTWTSSNEKVATVDANGNVYAAGTGNATITVTSTDGAVNETVEVSVSYTVLQWIIVIVLFGWIWY